MLPPKDGAPAGPNPRQSGYRWPAEWELHAATWVSWPHNRETWPGRYEAVRQRFVDLVRLVARYEPVFVLAGGANMIAEARRLLGDISDVEIVDIPTNDAWCRDHGPTFLSGPDSASPALIDWQYNAWGGKYPPFDEDNAVPTNVAAKFGYRRYPVELVLEGGAIETNGRGLLLASPSCILNDNRNPGLTVDQVEQLFADYLAVDEVLWLPHGELAGDDTDGHVDQLARFVGPTTVVVAAAGEVYERNAAELEQNGLYLNRLSTASGERLDVVALPLPRPMFFNDQRLPASYCNFYVVNGGVLVPQFRDPADLVALSVLREHFPDREIIGFDSTDFVVGLGAIHCLTQQQPAGAGFLDSRTKAYEPTP